MRVVRSNGGFALDGEDNFTLDANRFLLAVRTRGLSSQTARAYAFDLLHFHRWLTCMTRELAMLRSADLVDFIASEQDAGAAPRSINRRLTTVRLLYRFCTGEEVDQGPGILRPAPHYKGPGRDHDLGLHRLYRQRSRKVRVKEPHLLIEPLTADQVRAFLRSLHRYRDLAIVHLMLLCGLRSREVLALEIADVVWTDQRLRIRGKGQRERAMPLPKLLARLLRDYVQLERPKTQTKHLFLVLQGRSRGQPMTAAGLRNLFRHRRRRPLLAPAHPHRFRHTFGTDMARAGVRLPILQRMMGHADMKTTLQYVELSLVDVAEEYRRAIGVIEGRYRRRRDAS